MSDLSARFRRLLTRGTTSQDAAPPATADTDLEVEPTRACPYCGEQVSRGATVCLYCERDLVPVMAPQTFALRFRSLSAPDGEESGPPHE